MALIGRGGEVSIFSKSLPNTLLEITITGSREMGSVSRFPVSYIKNAL
jgi:hypothetical protein